MAKTTGIGSGLDDLAKIIVKAMKGPGRAKTRYNFMQKVGEVPGTRPRSMYPRGKPKPAPKPAPKPKVGPKPKAKPVVDGPRVGRIAKTPPPKKTYDKYPKGKSIAQTPSEQRAAERMSNRLLRGGGSKGPNAASSKPVDLKGSIISPPPKATMRPATPRGSKPYEADPTRRFENPPKAPKKAPKKPKQPKGTKPSQGTKKSTTGYTSSSSVKPTGNTSIGQGKKVVSRDVAAREKESQSRAVQETIRSNVTETNAARLNTLRENVKNAKTPQARAKASKALSGFISQLNKRK